MNNQDMRYRKKLDLRPILLAMIVLIGISVPLTAGCGSGAVRSAAVPTGDVTPWEMIYGKRPESRSNNFNRATDANGHYKEGIYLTLSDIELPEEMLFDFDKDRHRYVYTGATVPAQIIIELYPNEEIIQSITLRRDQSGDASYMDLPVYQKNPEAYLTENDRIVTFMNNAYQAALKKNGALPPLFDERDVNGSAFIYRAEMEGMLVNQWECRNFSYHYSAESDQIQTTMRFS